MMRHTKQGQLFTQIVLELFKLNGLLVAEGDQITKEHALSSARWKILGALALSSHAMTVPQIANNMGQTRQSVQRLADAMHKDGFLDYQVNPYHKRAKLVALSNKGEQIYSLLERKQIPWANSSSADISVGDMDVTLSVLKKMIKAFEAS
jgi:DNA-binding MarR family transcriptional regulator